MTVRPGWEQYFASADRPDALPARDLVGYAGEPPAVRWPNGARVAVQVVLNYEEGSERSFPMGDGRNDVLHDVANAVTEQRDLAVESAYGYGSRAGVWRLLRVFDRLGVPVTFFASAVALLRNPRLCEALARSHHEVAGHGYRWSNHFEMPPEVEREAIARALDSIEGSVGRRPVGWYSRKASVNTRELLVEAGGILYDSNAFDDDLPYWTEAAGRPHLVVPYTLVCNDVRFVVAPGFASPDDFHRCLRDTLDRLRDDGDGAARMMSVGLHPRLSGHPARALAVARFLEHALACEDVWVARRVDVAEVFASQHPPPGRRPPES
jgi:peptidoglycan/xylan/chitin deacetylase (PgdA/CDA1 family)